MIVLKNPFYTVTPVHQNKMARNTLEEAKKHEASLLEALSVVEAIRINFRDNSMPLYEKEATDEYYLIDVILEDKPRTVLWYEVSKDGKVSFCNATYKGEHFLIPEKWKEGINLMILPVLQKWISGN